MTSIPEDWIYRTFWIDPMEGGNASTEYYIMGGSNGEIKLNGPNFLESPRRGGVFAIIIYPGV